MTVGAPATWLASIAAEPWAYEPARLVAFWRALGAAVRAGDADSTLGLGRESSEDEPPPYEVIDGVAHLPIVGTILRRPPRWMRYFGFAATGTEETKAALERALDDRSVKSVLLRIDSPGGVISGIEELGRAIYEARGKKQISAYATDICASAAYWLGAQAGHISAGRTTEVGSIGVYRVLADYSKAVEADGIKVHLIRSGEHKGAGVFGAAISDEQLAVEQQLVDEAAEVFVDAVSRGRGMSRDAAKKIATGRVWMGPEAKRLGLVDAIEDLSGAHARAARAGSNSLQLGAPAPRATKKERSSTMNLEAILAKLDESDRKAVLDELARLNVAASKKDEPKDELADLPAAARKRIEDAEKKAAESAAQIAELQEKQVQAEYEAKASAMPGVVGLATKELGQALSCLDRGKPLPKELAEKVAKSFAAMSAVTKQSAAFREFGSNATGASGNAFERARAMAKDLMKTDAKLSEAAAINAVFERNPDLYRQHAEENGRGAQS